MTRRTRITDEITIGSLLLPVVVFTILVTGCERRSLGGRSEDNSPILAEVNGKVMTQKEFDVFLPVDYQDVLTLDEKRAYLDRWITMQLLYDEVVRSGMEIPDKLGTQMEAYRKGLVADLLVQQVIQEKAVVHDREVREYYDAHADEYVTEYRVSHILVNSREDAEAVKEQIGKRSFTYLARKHSIDKHSRYGGDLGYLSKGNMIPEFENIVFGMKVGDVSDVIESDFGYHILKVTEIRGARFKLSYEDVKQEIANNLMLQKRETVYDSLVASIRSRANIRILEQQLSAGTTKTAQSSRWGR